MAKEIKCGSSCFLRGGKECRKKRSCACACGPLAAINPNLYDACVKQCNSGNRPLDHEDFMCRFVGGEVLFVNYGIQACGYTITDSAQGQAWQIQTEADAEADDKSRQVTLIIVGALVLVIAGGLFLLFRRSKKAK